MVKKQGRRRGTTAKKNVPQNVENHPAFGIWADREDMKDHSAWLRKIRASGLTGWEDAGQGRRPSRAAPS